MEPFKPRNYGKRGPEKKVQESVEGMLRKKGWFVMRTHGNMWQSGFPDDFATHSRYGQRWVEIKLPEGKGSKFTPAQMEDFPKLCANGSGVWILTGGTEEEYKKLFCPPNWYTYLSIWRKGHYG